jgi:hypothetical protein
VLCRRCSYTSHTWHCICHSITLPTLQKITTYQQKLPVCHKLTTGEHEHITILEAVVRQTGIYVYVPSHKGRLSVYWAIKYSSPSAPFKYTLTHHVDIRYTLFKEPPTEKAWKDWGAGEVRSQYRGEERGDAAQVEKVDHPTATRMLKNLGYIDQMGPSLGSFSVSVEILVALCEEYK